MILLILGTICFKIWGNDANQDYANVQKGHQITINAAYVTVYNQTAELCVCPITSFNLETTEQYVSIDGVDNVNG